MINGDIFSYWQKKLPQTYVISKRSKFRTVFISFFFHITVERIISAITDFVNEKLWELRKGEAGSRY